jgi:hypothetical protein
VDFVARSWRLATGILRAAVKLCSEWKIDALVVDLMREIERVVA